MFSNNKKSNQIKPFDKLILGRLFLFSSLYIKIDKINEIMLWWCIWTNDAIFFHDPMCGVRNLDEYKAVYSQTTRGKEQLIFCGQPFIYEKSVRMPNGQMKKFWRCNQWCAQLFAFFYVELPIPCEFSLMISFLSLSGFSM